MPFETTSTEAFARRLVERTNDAIADAIQETDWTETAVLEVVVARDHPSVTPYDHTSGIQAIDTDAVVPDIHVRRYADRAPPQREGTIRGKQCEIYRVTKPLLDQLADDHAAIRAITGDTHD